MPWNSSGDTNICAAAEDIWLVKFTTSGPERRWKTLQCLPSWTFYLELKCLSKKRKKRETSCLSAAKTRVSKWHRCSLPNYSLFQLPQILSDIDSCQVVTNVQGKDPAIYMQWVCVWEERKVELSQYTLSTEWRKNTSSKLCAWRIMQKKNYAPFAAHLAAIFLLFCMCQT